jgi:hypothetical protein
VVVRRNVRAADPGARHITSPHVVGRLPDVPRIRCCVIAVRRRRDDNGRDRDRSHDDWSGPSDDDRWSHDDRRGHDDGRHGNTNADAD